MDVDRRGVDAAVVEVVLDLPLEGEFRLVLPDEERADGGRDDAEQGDDRSRCAVPAVSVG